MNVVALKDQLKDQPEEIEKVLIAAGLDEESIKYRPSQHLIASPRPGGDNPAGILVYTDSLKVLGTTRNEYTGDILTLVMKLKDCDFKEAINFVAKEIGFKDDEVKYKPPFGGFYKKIARADEDFEQELTEHSESELPSPNCLSKRFLDDNIPLITQEQWGVRYSIEDDAVLIPIYSMSGKLIGCKARANGDVEMDKRWWAKIRYPKTQVVYGLFQNYANIVQKGTLLVFEAEKSVLQCAGYGCLNAVAVAGHAISKIQVRQIKSMLCKRIIVCFDEGLSEDEIKFEAEKLVSKNRLITNKVGYVFDPDHEVLKAGGKESPSDNGKEKLLQLLNKHVRWIN